VTLSTSYLFDHNGNWEVAIVKKLVKTRPEFLTKLATIDNRDQLEARKLKSNEVNRKRAALSQPMSPISQ
jgi:hypothetical protein